MVGDIPHTSWEEVLGGGQALAHQRILLANLVAVLLIDEYIRERLCV